MTMTTAGLLRRSLGHYWRTNLAVISGVIAATAVIGGALIVGDSVRDSLRQMSLDRLGGVDHALSGGRFFREDLTDELAVNEPLVLAPAVVLVGSLTHEVEADEAAEGEAEGESKGELERAGGVQVFGVDDRFWRLMKSEGLNAPQAREVVLNERAARDLGAAVGDEVSLVVEIPAAIPRDALLGDRNETVAELTLTVAAIAGDATTQGRFGLNPSQQLPLNAFVSLAQLQSQLGIAHQRRSVTNPVEQPARINALFAGRPVTEPGVEDAVAFAPAMAEQLTETVAEAATLQDLALRIVTNSEHGYLSLESEQMILENAVADAAHAVADDLGLKTSPVLVYLVNEIANADDPSKYSMYAVAAGIDLDAQPPPFGPFEYVGPAPSVDAGEIVINDWLAKDLGVAPGDLVNVKYHVVGDRGELPEVERTFRVAGIVRLAGAADDRGFTPEVPGITDVEDLGDWRQPFPLNLDRVTPRDDEYWDPQDDSRRAYRATPKIFLPLAAAQELWQSRYGRLTSFRFAPSDDEPLAETAAKFDQRLLNELSPEATGLVFMPVKAQGLQAAQGTTDFTGLFIAFSFFLIVAAAILIGLLFRLGIERRITELGLLSALGLPPRRVRLLFLLEGAILVLIGGGLGVAAAIGYAALMVYGLTTWWIGAIGTRFLFVSVRPVSLLAGFGGACAIALLAVWWALRQTRDISPRDMLHGQTSPLPAPGRRQGRLSHTLFIACGTAAVSLLGLSLTGLLPEREAFGGFSWQVVAFFLVGTCALIATLALLAMWLAADRGAAVRGHGVAALGRLGLRNAARQRSRSLLTASLIAWATFVIVAIAAGHRNPASETPERPSGNGGFALLAEANVPLLFDLNTEEGRAKLGIDAPDDDAARLLGEMHAAPFRVNPGENASCLNLYRTQLPTILGVPQEVIEQFDREQRFRFANTPDAQPWLLLNKELPEGRVPVLGDMNTLQYSLHLGIGGVLDVPQSDGQLEVVGMLDGSVFQGVLLMSEEHFHRLFPDRAGFEYFLIEVDPRAASALSTLLETELGDYGFDVVRTADRLAEFLAVQNTYLSTFQTLGGLGLLLGTIGLATVMLRNVLERRSELALLRAVGFRDANVSLLVLWENACLLIWGLGAGTLSALLAMSPHLTTTGADVPWRGLLLMLAAVLVIGMAAALVAVREAVRTPIVATLRGD